MYIMHSYSIPHKPIAESSESIPNRSHKSTIKRQYRHLCSDNLLLLPINISPLGASHNIISPNIRFALNMGFGQNNQPLRNKTKYKSEIAFYICDRPMKWILRFSQIIVTSIRWKTKVNGFVLCLYSPGALDCPPATKT